MRQPERPEGPVGSAGAERGTGQPPVREREQAPTGVAGSPEGAAAAGPACPACGAPRQADHTPSCACGPRAADAMLEARTAEAAAAEDFNPLRIRPYVALEETGHGTGQGTGHGTGREEAGAGAAGTPGAADAPDAAARSGASGGVAGAAAVPAGTGDGAEPAQGAGVAQGTARGTEPAQGAGPAEQAADADADAVPAAMPDASETTMLLRAPAAPSAAATADTAATSVLPTPLAPPADAPNATDLRMFEPTAGGPAGPRTPTPAPEPAPAERRRPRRAALAGAAVVAVAVLGTVGYASDLFSYESPARDQAPADVVRAGVPEPSTDMASAREATDDASASPESASPSPSASASGNEEASPSSTASPSASHASPAASRTAEPSRSATSSETSTEATESQAAEDDTGDDVATVLRRGDQGPEVAELQQRLRQVHLYLKDADGHYDRQVEEAVSRFQWTRGISSDESGTYGPATRAQLERETQEP